MVGVEEADANTLPTPAVCASKNKPLICFIMSQLLKQRYPKMAVVQRAISVAMYGNGTSKQVCVSMYQDCIII